jgi:CheY-like chemotaxis protein
MLMDAAAPAGKTILVVEDSDMEREGLAAVLRREGYAVLTAANGQEALTCLRGSPRPDLVLLDMLLPGIDGWELLQGPKGGQRDPALAGIPVVIMTGMGIGSPEWAGWLGAAGYLHKPLEIASLLETVRRCGGCQPPPSRP